MAYSSDTAPAPASAPDHNHEQHSMEDFGGDISDYGLDFSFNDDEARLFPDSHSQNSGELVESMLASDPDLPNDLDRVFLEEQGGGLNDCTGVMESAPMTTFDDMRFEAQNTSNGGVHQQSTHHNVIDISSSSRQGIQLSPQSHPDLEPISMKNFDPASYEPPQLGGGSASAAAAVPTKIYARDLVERRVTVDSGMAPDRSVLLGSNNNSTFLPKSSIPSPQEEAVSDDLAFHRSNSQPDARPKRNKRPHRRATVDSGTPPVFSSHSGIMLSQSMNRQLLRNNELATEDLSEEPAPRPDFRPQRHLPQRRATVDSGPDFMSHPFMQSQSMNPFQMQNQVTMVSLPEALAPQSKSGPKRRATVDSGSTPDFSGHPNILGQSMNQFQMQNELATEDLSVDPAPRPKYCPQRRATVDSGPDFTSHPSLLSQSMNQYQMQNQMTMVDLAMEPAPQKKHRPQHRRATVDSGSTPDFGEHIGGGCCLSQSMILSPVQNQMAINNNDSTMAPPPPRDNHKPCRPHRRVTVDSAIPPSPSQLFGGNSDAMNRRATTGTTRGGAPRNLQYHEALKKLAQTMKRTELSRRQLHMMEAHLNNDSAH